VSIKDDVDFVKQELTTDEKMLEGALKFETFIAKHKIKLAALVVAIVLFFGIKSVNSALNQMKIEDANIALVALESGVTGDEKEELLSDLKNSPALYALYQFKLAVENNDTKTLEMLSHTPNSVLADSSRYALSSIQKQSVDSDLYKEMALLNQAYLLIQEGEMTQAREKLSLIADDSTLSQFAKLMMHATLKGTK